MKVLFIFKSENFMAPTGLCTISAVARQEGHEVYLSQTNQEDPLVRIAELKPDIVAYSSSTGEAKHYLRINRAVKKDFPDIFTIMGGAHPTFYSLELIRENTLDAICVGEGEEAFADLLRALSSGVAISGIPNILTKSDASITVRNLVEDLDSLPFPDYGLLYDTTPMGKAPLKPFMASRGCPYSCTYCFNSAWHKIYSGCGKVVRRNSVDYVIENIRRVKDKWPLSSIKFEDDIFTYHADDWLEEFSTKYRQHIGLPFFILTRCNLLTEDMVKLLKNAGCRSISMSIEAGNPQIREELLKRRMSNEQIIAAHRLCEKYGIYTFTNCILGLPGTTLSQDIESLDLCLESRVTWAEFPIFFPYPKTELGDYVISQGMYIPDYEQMHTSCLFRSPLNSFTEKEKGIQRNLSLLASVTVVFPWLRNLVVNHLINWPPNRFFIFLYWIAKQRVIPNKVYVTKTSFWEALRISLRTLKQAMFQHTEEKVE